MSNLIHGKLLEMAARSDKRLHHMISSNGVIHVSKSCHADIFTFLAQTLVRQQLSKSAANSIWTRMASIATQSNLSLFDYCTDMNFEKLRLCGLSNNKTLALLALRDYMLPEPMTDSIMAGYKYEDIVSYVTSIRGFGQWSADMVAIFFTLLPDVFPSNDAALIRGLKIVLGAKYDESIHQVFRPYRSYFARHIWHALDTGQICQSFTSLE